MRAAWVLVAVVATLVAAAEPAADSAVVVLTQANFESVIKSEEFVLVEFFAPWCGHCKSLAPEYEKAAKVLKEYKVTLASVDATVEQALGKQFEVKGYPTLKFFHNGVPSNYEGGRTQAKIVKWVLSAINAPLKTLTTAESVKEFAAAQPVSVVGFGEVAALQAVSAADNDLVYALATAPAAKVYGVPVPSVVVLHASGDKAVHEGPFTEEAITAFVDRERFPTVVAFSMENARDIWQTKSGKIAFLFSAEANADFTALATEYRGRLLFVTSDGSVSRLNDHLGASSANFPQLILLGMKAGSNQFARYPLAGAPTLDAMKEHITAFLAGSLAPTLKSEAAPADNTAPVKIVTGNTFADIVLDPSKNVMLEIYAPWCGHCKSLAPVYDKLAADLLTEDHVVVAKMDGTLNEVDGLSIRGFPTLKFYPAGANKTPIDYSGARDFDSLKKFILDESVQPAATEGGEHQEL